MWSAKQATDKTPRDDRFPTEWALGYGNEPDPELQAQQSDAADEAALATLAPPSSQFG